MSVIPGYHHKIIKPLKKYSSVCYYQLSYYQQCYHQELEIPQGVTALSKGIKKSFPSFISLFICVKVY